MHVSVRTLERQDIDFVHRMTLNEQWNVTRADIVRMRDFEPEGCFIAEVNGEPVGHVFSIKYGRLGWIGLLIVESERRRCGIGTVLMRKALDYLSGREVETMELEAVPEIANLYRRLGFVDEYDSLRFVGTSHGLQSPRGSSAELIKQEMTEEIARFDVRYFGEYRGRVLDKLFAENPELSFVSCSNLQTTGYITCRKAESGYVLGPWVCMANRRKDAEELFLACTSKLEPNTRIHIGVPSPNRTAVHVLLGQGFVYSYKSIRMRFGKELAERPDGIFAIAGAMKG